MLFNMAGGQVNQVARGFLVYQITQSPRILGAVAFAEALPVVTLSLFGGVIADRLDRKRLVLLGQWITVANAAFIAVSIATDTLAWPHLLAVAAIQGTSWSLTIPARYALVPQLVGRESLGNAMAVSGAGTSATILVGPAIGGLLYAWNGPAVAYYLVAALGLIAVGVTSLVRRPPVDVTPVRSTVLADIQAGLSYVGRDRLVLILLLVPLGISLLTMPLRALLPALVVEVYHRESESLGLLLSVIGLGSLAGSLLIAVLGNRRRGLMFIAAGIASGAALLVVAWVPIYAVALAVLSVYGLGDAGHRVLTQALVMEHVEDRFRGRVMSVNEMRLGILFLGALPAGAAAESIGIETTLAVLGIAALAVSVLVLLTQSKLRGLQ
jgi:MFS family permease